MEQIFGNENEGGGAAAAMDDIEFPHLRSLKLLRLPELKNFCSAFKDDPDEQFLFDKKVALPALEKLEILGGGNFKEIWHPQFSVTSFSQLKILKVANCNKLLNVIPFNLLQSLRNLEKLCVARCDSVEEIIEVGRLGVEEGNASAVLSQLRFLVLGKLPKLAHLWWDFPHGALGCRNLTSIHIFECNSLKSVFPHSIASSLVQLQTLKIVSCQMMETIIAKDRDGDVEIIVFPQLRTLVLKNLPKLMGFYTGRCTQKHETNDKALDESTEEGDLCISIQPLFDDKVCIKFLI
ncbi:hypothetical protein L1049_000126 [Liquidambar formosana]|uniref:Disease resistance protein At4g27190-like leucine-rich repeats domain-containing protein n=1 Tax=Liquidambar formosana TaxID=63359 RepID=A0AAP0R2E1_LIQFO